MLGILQQLPVSPQTTVLEYVIVAFYFESQFIAFHNRGVSPLDVYYTIILPCKRKHYVYYTIIVIYEYRCQIYQINPLFTSSFFLLMFIEI